MSLTMTLSAAALYASRDDQAQRVGRGCPRQLGQVTWYPTGLDAHAASRR